MLHGPSHVVSFYPVPPLSNAVCGGRLRDGGKKTTKTMKTKGEGEKFRGKLSSATVNNGHGRNYPYRVNEFNAIAYDVSEFRFDISNIILRFTTFFFRKNK